MRAFIAGNGSMGRRRERDLRALGVNATAYDAWPRDRGLTPEQHEAWNAADVVVLSTPPLTKHRATYWASEEGKPCFTEADVASTRFAHFPSCTPLFCEDIIRLTATERPLPLGYILHVGQHVEDWHPGAPSSYYAYQEQTSPPREMLPFELIWLTHWLGPVTKAFGFLTQHIGQTTVRHESGARGVIVIDALSRPAIRRLTQFGDGWRRDDDIQYSEDTYLREMRAFVESVEGGKPWPYTLAEERANLEVLHTIERSG